MLPNQYLLSVIDSLLGQYVTRLRKQQVKVA
jgi:hypothetical protein